MRVIEFDAVVADIMARPADNGIRLVGIDGPSGLGKTHLAGRLAARLGAPTVEIDDFVSWTDFGGWWPRFEEQVVTPLLAGEAARYQVRDWAGDEFGTSLGGWKTAGPARVVILEGVTCTRQAMAGRLAYGIWVEAPEEVRLRRGVARDGESHRRLWLTWMAEEREFFTRDRTLERADLRLDGDPQVPHHPDSQVVSLD